MKSKKTKSLISLTLLMIISVISFSNLNVSANNDSIKTISSGNNYTMFLKNDGTVWTTGSNLNGQLGYGDINKILTPAKINITDVKDIVTGHSHAMFLKNDGTVWATGQNKFGQFGNGTTVSTSTPQKIDITDVKNIAIGRRHTIFLKNDGTVWATGENTSGQLGDGTADNKSTPVQVNITDVKYVATGWNQTFFLKNDGTVWATGINNYGVLGDGTTTDKYTPVKLNITNVKAIASGYWHTVFLKNDGTVWATGKNDYGELGDGTNIHKSTPVKINITDVKDIAAGIYHTMFLKNDGTVWATGYNNHGQLGDGTNINKSSPVQVNITDVKDIAVGSYHAVFLKNDGTVWATGHNSQGELGDGTITDKNTPVDIKSKLNILDRVAPVLTLTVNTTLPTTDNVIITATATDDIQLVSIQKNDEAAIPISGTSITETFTVSANGTYSVEVKDTTGNSMTKPITIRNIDKAAPELTLTIDPNRPNPTGLKIKATATDDVAIQSITLPDGTIVNGESAEYIVTENDSYSFIATDAVGNTITKTIVAIPNPAEDNWVNREVARQVGCAYNEILNSHYTSIISFSKKSSNLTGTLPNDILKLVNLTTLDVSDNQLIGEVPNELKSKFSVDSFRDNLFRNVEQQKQLVFVTT